MIKTDDRITELSTEHHWQMEMSFPKRAKSLVNKGAETKNLINQIGIEEGKVEPTHLNNCGKMLYCQFGAHDTPNVVSVVMFACLTHT